MRRKKPRSIEEKHKLHLIRSKELRVPIAFESVFGFGRKKSPSQIQAQVERDHLETLWIDFFPSSFRDSVDRLEFFFLAGYKNRHMNPDPDHQHQNDSQKAGNLIRKNWRIVESELISAEQHNRNTQYHTPQNDTLANDLPLISHTKQAWTGSNWSERREFNSAWHTYNWFFGWISKQIVYCCSFTSQSPASSGGSGATFLATLETIMRHDLS